MDMLWNKYWVDTLSNTPLLSRNYKDFVSGQIRDLGASGNCVRAAMIRLFDGRPVT